MIRLILSFIGIGLLVKITFFGQSPYMYENAPLIIVMASFIILFILCPTTLGKNKEDIITAFIGSILPLLLLGSLFLIPGGDMFITQASY